MKQPLYEAEGEVSKRGVALIIVLGFLSIMVLMAIAFLTQARMERLVADSGMDAQRGRQMARTALNAAMSDYSYQLYGESKLMLPPTDSDFDLFLSTGAYASGEVQPAITGDNGTLAGSGLQLMKGEARNWIPRSYLGFEGFAMDNARWMLVRRDPSRGAAANNPIVGRYAYLCFDMSGGLDANLIALTEGVANVGNATNRSSVRDLGMEKLNEMQTVQGLGDKPPDASRFKRLRRGWHGFDTLAELILLTNGRYNGGENQRAVTYNGTDYYYIDEGVSAEELPSSRVWGPPGGSDGPRWREGDGWSRIERAEPALNPTNVSDLVPYSLASFRGWEFDPNTAKWATNDLVAWDEHDSWTDSDWEDALGDLVKQFPDDKLPGWWEDALEDYTSTNGYPKGTNYPSPKNVPMLNEVGLKVQPQLTANPNELQIDIELQVEVWFPFPSDDNKRSDTYTLAPTIGIGSPVGAADIWIPMRGNGNEYAMPAQILNPLLPVTFTASYGDGFSVKGLNYRATVPVTMNSINPALTTNMPIQVGFTTNSGMTITTGGRVVDWMPAGVLNLRRDAGGTLPLDPTDPAYAKTYFYEAWDPRLNHLNEEGWELGLEIGTMGNVNQAAISRGYGTNGDSTNFYCRNAPMTSPVELGYISTGEPWKTLEFCTKEGADALARIVSQQMLDELYSVGVAYTNGTVNPNTSSSNVLMAVFSGLRFKDDGSALDDSELDELVNFFTTTTKTKKVADTANLTKFQGACMRGIDWIWAEPFQPDGFFGMKWSKNERHRLIEKTWGLFNPNNSMFTVLAIGQVVKEGPAAPGVWSEDDLITGERRAVALVWRDPTPPGLGKPHEMFIRMFKFLDE